MFVDSHIHDVLWRLKLLGVQEVYREFDWAWFIKAEQNSIGKDLRSSAMLFITPA